MHFKLREMTPKAPVFSILVLYGSNKQCHTVHQLLQMKQIMDKSTILKLSNPSSIHIIHPNLISMNGAGVLILDFGIMKSV